MTVYERSYENYQNHFAVFSKSLWVYFLQCLPISKPETKNFKDLILSKNLLLES